MPIAQAAFTPSQQLDFLAVFSNFCKELSCLGIEDGSAYGHLYYPVFAIFAERAARATALAVGSEDVTLVTQMEQSPDIAVTPQYDMAAAAAVASIRSSLGYIFGSVEVARACAAFAAAAKYLDIVYEIGICHYA